MSILIAKAAKVEFIFNFFFKNMDLYIDDIDDIDDEESKQKEALLALAALQSGSIKTPVTNVHKVRSNYRCGHCGKLKKGGNVCDASNTMNIKPIDIKTKCFDTKKAKGKCTKSCKVSLVFFNLLLNYVVNMCSMQLLLHRSTSVEGFV
jgi:hypothetical protein